MNKHNAEYMVVWLIIAAGIIIGDWPAGWGAKLVAIAAAWYAAKALSMLTSIAYILLDISRCVNYRCLKAPACE